MRICIIRPCGFRFHYYSPIDLLEQHIAREHGTAVFHQQAQQLVLLERQLHLLLVNEYGVSTLIHTDAAGYQRTRLILVLHILGAAQDRTNARDQLHHAERLGNVIIRTGVQTDYLVVLRVFRSQQNDRNLRRIRPLRADDAEW